MSDPYENKVVDYAGTAVGVITIMVCTIFYPATVIAVHSKGIIRAFGGEDIDFIIQIIIFCAVVGVILGVMEVAKEAGTRGAYWACTLFLLITLYLPTLMPFIRIVQDIYK